MTGFTDDDLKRLKENQYELFGFSKEHVEALLVRLQAAERLIWRAGLTDAQIDQRISDWRKAAGK